MNAGLDGGVHDAVSLALKKALAYADKQGVGHVLEVAAFLSPDNLTLELLGCNRPTARRLCELSLLRHVGNDVYTIHRLHQEAARDGLSPLKAISAIRKALEGFDPNNSDAWKFGISMIPHVESLETNVDIMMTNGAIILENDGYLEYACEYAWILHSYAKILDWVPLNEAKNTTLDYHDIDERMIRYYNNHNKTYYKKARLYYEQSLEMQRHVYGPEYMNTDLASTLNNLGNLERKLGNYDEARLYYEQSLAMQRHVYGPDAKNTELATILRNLGELKIALRNYDKARVYYEQLLEMQRNMYGPEAKNTDLASRLRKLGNLERKLGNYDKARVYYEQALEMKQHVYGPEARNTDLASTLGNVGSLERKLGNYDKARLYYEQSLEMKRHVYGPEAKNTNFTTTLSCLGILEMILGNYDKARVYYDQSLEM
jgi:tetratricopeptide (TPR) repeat protein